MSVFSEIIANIEKLFKAIGTDVEKFAVAFWKLFKKAPSALQTVENFVCEVAPVHARAKRQSGNALCHVFLRANSPGAGRSNSGTRLAP